MGTALSGLTIPVRYYMVRIPRALTSVGCTESAVWMVNLKFWLHNGMQPNGLSR